MGYVSNSSSSSFIVAFPKKPESVGDVQKILFGDEEYYYSPYGDRFEVEEIANVVYNDIKNQEANDFVRMHESVGNGWFAGSLDVDLFRKEDDKIDWEEYSAENGKIVDKIILDFMKKNKGSFFYVFDYSDNDGEMYSSMEHGDLFDNLDYIKTSHH